jgi:hypothetical protein
MLDPIQPFPELAQFCKVAYLLIERPNSIHFFHLVFQITKLRPLLNKQSSDLHLLIRAIRNTLDYFDNDSNSKCNVAVFDKYVSKVIDCEKEG